jgi:hypothetical protein|tara:strand:- start:217 stop:606 length:390 start_codon:yes stop_codon:yes gene_type:complete
MKIILITLTIMLTSTICYGQDSSDVFRAQRFKNDLNFQKPYRILKTTFKNLDEFQSYYPGTEITLEKLLRFHLFTEIHINQEENKLISMDQTEFQLKKMNSAEAITKETVELISNMYFGSNEMKEFSKK